MRNHQCALISLIAIGILAACAPKQRVDSSFRPVLPNPAGLGSIVWIDEIHNNILKLRGRYRPFAQVLRLDGYVVRPFRSQFADDQLREVRILVIGNALPDSKKNTILAPSRPAFRNDEIEAILRWVSDGGRLLLLVDHMPLAGAALELAGALGFELSDGFVIDWDAWDPTVFERAKGTLREHPITSGRSPSEVVSRVAAFHGAAFRAPGAEPILVIGPGFESFLPDRPWDIDETTPRFSVEGWWMGATRQIGAGRVAVYGDATMFSAQLAKDGSLMGMNAAEGRENLQLLLNTLHWLDESFETE